MYSPAYRTPPQLAAQNNGASWLDCNRRRRPRPHRFAPMPVAGYHRCTRCPVMTRSAGTPDPWLGRPTTIAEAYPIDRDRALEGFAS